MVDELPHVAWRLDTNLPTSGRRRQPAIAAGATHERRRLATLAGMTTLGFWLVVGSLVLVEATIIVTALRIRIQPLAARSVVGGRPAEVVWTLLPALLLITLAVMSRNAG